MREFPHAWKRKGVREGDFFWKVEMLCEASINKQNSIAKGGDRK
jgi:hypothetical protein